MFLIVLVIGLMIFGVGGFVFFGLLNAEDKKTQKNADSILDKTFDGSDTATYKVSSVGGLQFDQVLEGAEKRGYDLHAQNQDNPHLTTLVFKKAA